MAWAAFRRARHVVLYAARAAEVDPGHLAVLIEGNGEQASYYPRVDGDDLVFHRARLHELVPGRFGIAEPTAEAPLLAHDVDDMIVIVPGVGFDRAGGRLGTGKGYYDRALPAYTRATRIGISLETCVVDRLPTDSWDVPMHVVATERDFLVVDPRVDAHPGDPPWT